MNSFHKSSEDTKLKDELMANVQYDTLKLNKGLKYAIQLYMALFSKKILFLYRNKFSLVAQLIIPGIILISSTLINKNQMDKSIYSPSMPMNARSFHKLEANIFIDSNHTEEMLNLAKIYSSSIKNDNQHLTINSKC